jgi:hypothetical protein
VITTVLVCTRFELGSRAVHPEPPADRSPRPTYDLHVIDITDDSITMDAKVIALLCVGLCNESPTFEILQLRDPVIRLLRGRVPPRFMIRPLDATPMRIVDRVLASIAVAGADEDLAARISPHERSGGWAPLRTNGTNAPASCTRNRMPAALSLLVAPQGIWLGNGPDHAFVLVPRDGTERTTLTRRLREMRRWKLLAGRGDVEIAGERVSYGEVVDAIDATAAAGFRWCVTPPMNLAARPEL